MVRPKTARKKQSSSTNAALTLGDSFSRTNPDEVFGTHSLVAVTLFAALLPAESETASFAQRSEALRQVILLFSAVTCGAALLIWLALPKRGSSQRGQQPQLTLSGIARVLTMSSVWLQAAIILYAIWSSESVARRAPLAAQARVSLHTLGRTTAN
jgi:hypothetical protein